MKRDHAFNIDELYNTNWEEYKADTPKEYEEDLDYTLPHPDIEEKPDAPPPSDPEDEFVRCQANAVGHFKYAKSPDEKRFYMKQGARCLAKRCDDIAKAALEANADASPHEKKLILDA